jgi:hypothetical protein
LRFIALSSLLNLKADVMVGGRGIILAVLEDFRQLLALTVTSPDTDLLSGFSVLT